MIKEILADAEKKFNSTINHLQQEFAVIRSNQTSPTLVEDIPVSAYDGEFPIKEVSAISVPEPGVILIQAWDQTIIPNIEAAIEKSDIGLSPATDGTNIRINVPQLSEEKRVELVKKVGAKAEEAKIAVRNVRQEKMKSLDNMCDDSVISENEHETARADVQKLVDEFTAKVDEMKTKKESSLSEI